MIEINVLNRLHYLQIGMIDREEVDVGVTSFFATVKRQEVVDFSPIIDYAEYILLRILLRIQTPPKS